MEDLPLELGAFGYLVYCTRNTYCVLKDLEHRYVYVSPGWLETLGVADPAEVLGKTAADLFPAWQAERYLEEEREVMMKGRVLDYVDVRATPTGGSERWRNIKAPRMEGGRIVGMTNLGMLLEDRALGDCRADLMPRLVKWMAKHAAETLSIAEIAGQCNMSRRSLERYFLENTGESPARYRMRCRVELAKALLQDPEPALVEVAAKCGFYDQSHFNRVFRKETGVTPSKWRERGRG